MSLLVRLRSFKLSLAIVQVWLLCRGCVSLQLQLLPQLSLACAFKFGVQPHFYRCWVPEPSLVTDSQWQSKLIVFFPKNLTSFYVGKQSDQKETKNTPDEGKVIKNYYKGRVIKTICWCRDSHITLEQNRVQKQIHTYG